MSHPIPSTRGVYKSGVGITITRANIEDEQARRSYENRARATPEEIVADFTPTSLQNNNNYKKSAKFAKLIARASLIMSKTK